MYPAISANHDDDHGGATGRTPAGAWRRDGFRIAPSVGYHNCRWVDREPNADPVHDAGCVRLSGSRTVVHARGRGSCAAGDGCARYAPSQPCSLMSRDLDSLSASEIGTLWRGGAT